MRLEQFDKIGASALDTRPQLYVCVYAASADTRCMRASMYIHNIYIHARAHTHTRTRAYTHTKVYVCNAHAHAPAHAHAHVHAHAHIVTHPSSHTPSRTNAQTHKYLNAPRSAATSLWHGRSAVCTTPPPGGLWRQSGSTWRSSGCAEGR
jgi:hypothetical protein